MELRYVILFIATIIFNLSVLSQDIIILKNNSEQIKCEIVAITNNTFTYKKDNIHSTIDKTKVLNFILKDYDNRYSKLFQDTLIKVDTIIKPDSTYYQATVNGVKLKDIQTPYIRIVGTSKFLSNKINVRIEFGQEIKYFKNTTTLKDGHGNPLNFNSMVDALNYMSYNRYEFLQAYVITVGSQNVYHYLMKRSK